MLLYVLDEKNHPVLEPDTLKWTAWFQGAASRTILRDDLPPDITVSTAFFGIDRNFSGSGKPLLWETMIFGGEHDEYHRRYDSHDAALAGHRKALQLAKSAKS